MSFLTAHWQKLAMANYVVEPAWLRPWLPSGTELDIWNGNCYVSLVGFMFAHTRLLGIPIPGHTDFEEVNLRFYVRRNEGGRWKRGVVFISEIVPRSAIAFVANTVYGENYKAMSMRHRWHEQEDHLAVEYGWRFRRQWQTLSVQADRQPSPILPGSEAEFITEHYWGYARRGASKTVEYEVTHPRWEQHVVRDYRIEADFGALYGSVFAPLNTTKPASVLLAAGSAITVEHRRVLLM